MSNKMRERHATNVNISFILEVPYSTFIILSYLILSYLILSDLILSDLILSYLILPYLTLPFLNFTRSFEAFIDAVQQVNSGKATAADYEEELASVASTYRTTAILEAGRRSLDENRAISILYGDVFNPCRPTSLSSA